MIITIDGPSAAGKSTLAKGLAKALRWIYLDSGATYRAVALLALEKQVNLDDAVACVEVTRNASIKFEYPQNGETKVFLNGRDISSEIRAERVSNAASKIAVHEELREELVKLQRQIAEGHDVIAEGRDMGSVVFPNANLKIYLDAPLEERAIRRMNDLIKDGIDMSFDEVKENLQNRDKRDKERKISPLVQTPDSIYINNGNLNIEDTLRLALKIIKEMLNIEPKIE